MLSMLRTLKPESELLFIAYVFLLKHEPDNTYSQFFELFLLKYQSVQGPSDSVLTDSLNLTGWTSFLATCCLIYSVQPYWLPSISRSNVPEMLPPHSLQTWLFFLSINIQTSYIHMACSLWFLRFLFKCSLNMEYGFLRMSYLKLLPSLS